MTTYVGGFSDEDIAELLDSLESNYLGWSSAMAPVIMGNPDRPELGAELTASFCRTDPAIARQFAEVTFRSDNRADLRRVETPTLILQCDDDIIAPISVGEVRARRDAQQHPRPAEGHRSLPAPERTRPDDRRDRGVPREPTRTSIAEVNRPGIPRNSIPWKRGWSHGCWQAAAEAAEVPEELRDARFGWCSRSTSRRARSTG